MRVFREIRASGAPQWTTSLNIAASPFVRHRPWVKKIYAGNVVLILCLTPVTREAGRRASHPKIRNTYLPNHITHTSDTECGEA